MLLNDAWGSICDQKLDIPELLKANHFLGQLIYRFQVKGHSRSIIWHGNECQAQQPLRVVVIQSRQEETSKVVTNTMESINFLMVKDLHNISNYQPTPVFCRGFWLGRTAIPKRIWGYNCIPLVDEIFDLVPPSRGNGGEAMEKCNSAFGWRGCLYANVIIRMAGRGHGVRLCGKFRHCSVRLLRPSLTKASSSTARRRCDHTYQETQRCFKSTNIAYEVHGDFLKERVA